MIILNPKKINTFNTAFYNFFKKYNNLDNLPYIECPGCNSSELIKWGHYNRNIYFIRNNIIEYKSVAIKRVRCKKCGATHALLPSFIIPYKQNLLDVILSSINNR